MGLIKKRAVLLPYGCGITRFSCVLPLCITRVFPVYYMRIFICSDTFLHSLEVPEILHSLELACHSCFFYSNCYSNSHTNHRVVSYWCGICHTVLYYAFLCLILTKIHSIHKWFVPFYVILCTYVFFHDLPTVGKMWANVNFYVSQIFIHD